MRHKKVIRFAVMEWVGCNYSRQLGQKLRAASKGRRLQRRLLKRGRDVFLAPITILTTM